LFYGIVVFLAGIGIAFFKGAVFAGICISYFPIMLVVMGIFSGQIKKATIAKNNVAKMLGGSAEESLSAIKLIVSFA
jgi:ABC-type multidrug transport system fused ATPase/permease subunit